MKAAAAAREGKLTTFGIVPDRPETGFGYIRRGAAHARIAAMISSLRASSEME